MVRSLLRAMILSAAAGCLSTTGGGPTVGLLTDPVQLTVVQRHSKPIPGLGGEAAIRIGDITGGQVLFTINGEDDRTVVDTISVKPGDLLHFDLGDKRYYVSVVTLRNFLVGDDFAEFEVSTRPPLP